jgi:hypothetical protein
VLLLQLRGLQLQQLGQFGHQKEVQPGSSSSSRQQHWSC